MSYQPIPTIDWWAIAPVSIVMVTGIVALLIEMFRPNRNNNTIVAVSLVGLFLAGLSVVPQFSMPFGSSFGGMVVRDYLGLVLQLLLITVCFVAFLFSEPYLREKRIAFAEFYQLALWASAGGMIMVTTENLLMFFLGLEVLGIALYCLTGMCRQELRSEESAMKYFLLGAFGTAFVLMGIAYLYGPTGSLRIDAVSIAVASDQPHFVLMALFGFGLLLVGLCFKSALVPFHQWTPDVYQGAPTNVTAFMASTSKIAAIGALIRVLAAGAPLVSYWFPIMFWVAILSMVVGNFAALVQKDVKRTLGYSSVANGGYMLVAVLAHVQAPEKVSLASTLFFITGYGVMTMGAFAVVSLAARDGKEGTRFQDLHGLWHRAPFAAGCLILFVASLIGVPPTVGFFGKMFIFNDALAAGLLPLALVLAVTSVVSAYYYLGIIQAVFVQEEGAVKNESGRPQAGLNLAVLLCALAIFGISLGAENVLKFMAPAEDGRQPVAERTVAQR